MKRVIAMLGVVVLATAAPAYAQQPASPADPHHPQGQAPTPPAEQPSPGPAAPTGGMMPMMAMCREMMSGHSMMGHSMMRGGGMGHGMMGGGQPMDSKAMSQMMEMRGEMMKAMGDILLKYAKRMQETPTPAK